MIPIAEQAAEAEREVRQRERVYPRLVDAGRLKPDTAQRKIDTMAQAAATLRFIERHAAGLRALLHHLRSIDGGGAPPDRPPPPSAEERRALLAHPPVAAVLAAWPAAEVLGIRAPAQAQPDMFPAD